MGLAEKLANRGAQVGAFTPREVADLYVLRELLEVAAARDRAAIFRANRAFHRLLFSYCPNGFLV